jgi:RNA polymerase sigma factor (sigma-70 family)
MEKAITREVIMLGREQQSRELSDQELVERARSGDQEAFSSLVRKYRAQALGWVNVLTTDSYMAEDIVQDALIRAFLHLGTLMDTRRFLPWLHRIVRNQANMKLRRGGPFARERPFSNFEQKERSSFGSHSREGPTVWGDIDHILFHLAHSSSNVSKNNNPLDGFMRKEMLQSLYSLLKCLTKREKSIFESHFFDQLSPTEIAVLFETTTDNVYNNLSRSRNKVRKERIRISLCDYIKNRATQGLPSKKVLIPPPVFQTREFIIKK